MTTVKHGIEVLWDPSLNKSTTFSEAERQALGIVGLVPDVTETEDLQLSRVMMQLGHKTTGLDRYIYLVNLLDHNETLFYRTVMSDPARFCRSSTTRPSAKHASSSVTSTGKHAACICR
jgi:malate dehydrogenase (oxaloacetate-decarboxylating)(NADP+)